MFPFTPGHRVTLFTKDNTVTVSSLAEYPTFFPTFLSKHCHKNRATTHKLLCVLSFLGGETRKAAQKRETTTH